MGDSAGANIVLRLLLDIRENSLKIPDASALVSLCPDTTFNVSKTAAQQDLVLDPKRMRCMQNDVGYQQFDFMQQTDLVILDGCVWTQVAMNVLWIQLKPLRRNAN
ncbi:Uncharacterised protein [Weissella viridescens]|uniref:Uncharacterized protein n=1 Tax=Weissella viridescens TaxID=1629 RepID=A0A380P2I9_WEIVI|nr:Uncharacterised protein [Weissella viridescens]